MRISNIKDYRRKPGELLVKTYGVEDDAILHVVQWSEHRLSTSGETWTTWAYWALDVAFEDYKPVLNRKILKEDWAVSAILFDGQLRALDSMVDVPQGDCVAIHLSKKKAETPKQTPVSKEPKKETMFNTIKTTVENSSGLASVAKGLDQAASYQGGLGLLEAAKLGFQKAGVPYPQFFEENPSIALLILSFLIAEGTSRDMFSLPEGVNEAACSRSQAALVQATAQTAMPAVEALKMTAMAFVGSSIAR